MSSFQTDLSTMQQAANHVFEVNEAVQAQLTSLLQRLEPLTGSWRGPAAVSLHALKQRWHENATRLNETLRGIGEGLVQAGRNYAASEETNQQGFTAVAGTLEP